MSDLSTSREQATLNAMIAGGAYVSLHNADEGDEPDGTSEVSAADYDRQEVAETAWTVTDEASGSQLTNDNVIEFGTTQNDWGTITHAAIWDSLTDGTPETATIEVSNSGDAPSGIDVEIPAGSLTFTLD